MALRVLNICWLLVGIAAYGGVDANVTLDDAPRPSVLLSAGRLAELRGEIDGWEWKREAYVGGIKANADLWLDRAIVVPERAGYYHNFFCSDGTMLAEPDDQRFRSDTYRCPACGRTYTGEKYDGGRRFLEHRWLYQACRDLAVVAAVENDTRYAAKAAKILRNYADVYPGHHTAQTKGGIMYQSLDEAVMMIPFAQAYDLVYAMDVIDDSAKRHIEDDLFRDSAEGLIAMGIGGNWGSWHLSAVGVIGAAIRDEQLFGYGIENFKSQIANQLGSDGLWPESVHTYHFYPLNAFIHLAEACANIGVDLYHWKATDGNSLEAMFTAPIAYMYPTTQLPAINDGWYGSYLPAGQYEAAYYRYRSPDIGWALQQALERTPRNGGGKSRLRDPWSVLLGQELPEEIPAPEIPSTNFGNIGIAVLRTQGANPTTATFDYGRHLGHGQMDKMGVTLFANGRVLAADYGTPGYGSAILPYYRGPIGHNTIVLPKFEQQKTTTGAIDVFDIGEDYTLARAIDSEAYPGVTWSRTVVLTEAYLLVHDDLKSDDERVFDFFFHSEGDTFATHGTSETPDQGPLTYDYLQDIKGHGLANADFEAAWGFDDGSGLACRIASSSPATVYSARIPAETAARRIPLLVARQSGSHVQFAALLIPFTREAQACEAAVRLIDDRVEVECGAAADSITLNAAPGVQRNVR